MLVFPCLGHDRVWSCPQPCYLTLLKALLHSLLILLLSAATALGGQGFSVCNLLSMETGVHHMAGDTCSTGKGCAAEVPEPLDHDHGDHKHQHDHESDTPCQSLCFLPEGVFVKAAREIAVPETPMAEWCPMGFFLVESCLEPVLPGTDGLVSLRPPGILGFFPVSLSLPVFTGRWLV